MYHLFERERERETKNMSGMSSFIDTLEEDDHHHHHFPLQDALIVQFVCLYVCEKSSSQTLGGDKTQIRTSFTL